MVRMGEGEGGEGIEGVNGKGDRVGGDGGEKKVGVGEGEGMQGWLGGEVGGLWGRLGGGEMCVEILFGCAKGGEPEMRES